MTAYYRDDDEWLDDEWYPPRGDSTSWRDGITRRIAVDIPGEDEQIRQLLREAEELLKGAHYTSQQRRSGEARATNDAGGWLADSRRATALTMATDELAAVVRLLTTALCARGTVTDEPPF